MNKFGINVELAGSNIICDVEESKIPQITQFLISKNIPIFGINTVTQSLEQMFLDIVNNDNKLGDNL